MDIQSSYHTIFEETNSIYHNVLSEVVSRVGLEMHIPGIILWNLRRMRMY